MFSAQPVVSDGISVTISVTISATISVTISVTSSGPGVGQRAREQFLVSVADPTHSRPAPARGCSERQLYYLLLTMRHFTRHKLFGAPKYYLSALTWSLRRVRDMMPGPQLTEQADHSVKVDHRQSTFSAQRNI